MQDLRVLWYDVKKGHGIAVDQDSNEYYLDSSKDAICRMLKRNDIISAKTSRLYPDNLLVVDDIVAIYHSPPFKVGCFK